MHTPYPATRHNASEKRNVLSAVVVIDSRIEMHIFLYVFDLIWRRAIHNDCLKRNSLRRLVQQARILQNYFIFRHATSTKNSQIPNCITLLIYWKSCQFLSSLIDDFLPVFRCVVNPYKTSFVIHLVYLPLRWVITPLWTTPATMRYETFCETRKSTYSKWKF